MKYPRWIKPRQFYDDKLHIAETSVWAEAYIQQMLQQTRLISKTNVGSTSKCSICSPATWAPMKTIQDRFKWRIVRLVPILQYCQLCFCQFKGWTFQGKWSLYYCICIILCALHNRNTLPATLSKFPLAKDWRSGCRWSNAIGFYLMTISLPLKVVEWMTDGIIPVATLWRCRGLQGNCSHTMPL